MRRLQLVIALLALGGVVALTVTAPSCTGLTEYASDLCHEESFDFLVSMVALASAGSALVAVIGLFRPRRPR